MTYQLEKLPSLTSNYDDYGSIESVSASSLSLSTSLSSSISTTSTKPISLRKNTHSGEQGLKQSLSAFTTFGLAFSNIGILANTSATFQTVLQRGGPISVLFGWNSVALLMICVSLSLAEICSIYPSSGGLYLWVYELLRRHPKTQHQAAFIAFVAGCTYSIGNIITIGITNITVALSIGSLLRIAFDYGLSEYQILFIAVFISAIHLVLNYRYMNVLAWLNKLNVFWSSVGLLLVILILSLFARKHQDARWVFSHYENETGFESPYYVFLLGMIGAAYSLFGSECSASVSEETENADISSPIAMVTSIITAWIFGFVYLLVLLFSIQDLDCILATTFNMPAAQLFWDAVGPLSTIGFLVLMIVCQFCSGATSFTVSSRQVYTLARGGGVPFRQQLQQINEYQLPGNAVVVTFALTCCVILPYPLSEDMFEIIISAATITVYSVYSLVLGCRLYLEADGKRGRFHLGRFSKPINLIGFAWTLFAVVVFMLPTRWPIDATHANYAGPALCVVVMMTYSIVSFSSPPSEIL